MLLLINFCACTILSNYFELYHNEYTILSVCTVTLLYKYYLNIYRAKYNITSENINDYKCGIFRHAHNILLAMIIICVYEYIYFIVNIKTNKIQIFDKTRSIYIISITSVCAHLSLHIFTNGFIEIAAIMKTVWNNRPAASNSNGLINETEIESDVLIENFV